MQTSLWRCVMGDGREEKGTSAHQGAMGVCPFHPLTLFPHHANQ